MNRQQLWQKEREYRGIMVEIRIMNELNIGDAGQLSRLDTLHAWDRYRKAKGWDRLPASGWAE